MGYVLDGLDGRIARLTKTASEFGVQLDSLADVLTFGAAPAFSPSPGDFGATDGIRQMLQSTSGSWVVAGFAFVVCGALRLARFNVQSKKAPETASKRYFVGLPTPAVAGMIAAVVHFFKSPILLIGSALLWCFLILLVSFLMISTVRYFSFKEFDAKKYGPRFALFSAAMLIGLVIFYSEIVLLVIATVYVSSGPVVKLVHLVRRFLPSVSVLASPRMVISKPRSQ